MASLQEVHAQKQSGTISWTSSASDIPPVHHQQLSALLGHDTPHQMRDMRLLPALAPKKAHVQTPALPPALAMHAMQLEIDGVTVLNNIFTSDQIAGFRQTNDDIVSEVKEKIAGLVPASYSYLNPYATISETQKPHYRYPVSNDCDAVIIQIAEGRLDLSVPMDRGAFAHDALYTQPIADLMASLLRTKYNHVPGILTLDSKTRLGSIHRDTVPIADDRIAEDRTYNDRSETHDFQPFYYTILIPLVDMGAANGGTRLALATHHQTHAEAIAQGMQWIQPEVKAGDALIFDGRIFHQGMPNTSEESRPVVYLVVAKNWYSDIDSPVIDYSQPRS